MNKKNKPLSLELKKFLKLLEKKTASELAARMGYRSSNTFSQWKYKGKIPRIAKERVRQVLKEFK